MDATDFSEKLTPEKRARETAAVKIRTKDGIDLIWFKEKTGYDLLELSKRSIPKFIEEGLVRYVRKGDMVTGVSLKRKGFLLCDTVSSGLL
jgi:coproporphyrinogen III oxidase-like Fe-S oxidoreductase